MNIVDRCRAWHKPGEAITGDVQLYLDAANEIERLRAENARLREDKDIIRSQERNTSYEQHEFKSAYLLGVENDDLKAALDVWNNSELGLLIAKLRADYAGKVREYSQASDEVERLLEVNEQLRATLEWLRSYVSGHTVYGLPHALEKINTALNEEPHAEIERLRAELNEVYEANGKLAYLASQNDRLRAALERQLEAHNFAEILEIARAALNKETK